MRFLNYLLYILITTSTALAQFGQAEYDLSFSHNANENDQLTVLINLEIPYGLHVYSSSDRLFEIAHKTQSGLGEPQIIMPETVPYTDIAGDTAQVFKPHSQIKLIYPILDGQSTPWQLDLAVTSQACNDQTCFPPYTADYQATGRATSSTAIAKQTTTSSEVADNFASVAPLDLGFDYERVDKTVTKSDKSIIFYLLLAFVGGILLNIMPCVLPVLSIKALSLVKSAHDDRRRVLHGSLAYTAGILISFLVIAILIIAIRHVSGVNRDWGFLMQEPIFVITLFAVIWCFALSLFDVFIIQLPGTAKATSASAKKGHLGSFFSGIFAVLLATPCTAPMLGSAIAVLLTKSDTVVILCFISIGLGLALPFIILALTPKALKLIPKPGNWMNTFKELMGFTLFGTCLFLGFVLQSQLGEHFFSFLVFLLPLSFGCWAYGRYAGPGQSTRRQWVISFLLLVGLYLSVDHLIKIPTSEEIPVSQVTDSTNLSVATTDSAIPEGLIQLKKLLTESKEPVFIDATAKWCATCQVNKKLVLQTDFIKQKFSEKKVHYVTLDFTKPNPKLSEFLSRFQSRGVPLYVLFNPSKDGAPITARKLPELLTESMVVEALETL